MQNGLRAYRGSCFQFCCDFRKKESPRHSQGQYPVTFLAFGRGNGPLLYANSSHLFRKMSDGLFLECCREIAQKYPSIEYKEMIIDNACMQLVQNPRQFDVLVKISHFHDIGMPMLLSLIQLHQPFRWLLIYMAILLSTLPADWLADLELCQALTTASKAKPSLSRYAFLKEQQFCSCSLLLLLRRIPHSKQSHLFVSLQRALVTWQKTSEALAWPTPQVRPQCFIIIWQLN